MDQLTQEAEEYYKVHSREFKVRRCHFSYTNYPIQSTEASQKHYEAICLKIKLILYICDKATRKNGLGCSADGSEDKVDLELELRDSSPLPRGIRAKIVQHLQEESKDEEREDDSRIEASQDESIQNNSPQHRPEAEGKQSDDLMNSQKAKELEEIARDRILKVWNLFSLSKK